ncbi:Zinc transporter ZupT [Clostridiales bacterium CHKCI001]|nr:Zinc transporter ZupT [Clostridiales bacterium CHKCI001]
MQIVIGLLIPFIGTTLGAACVFFQKGELKPLVQKALLGFASGVMVAASVWSLLIPSMDMSEHMGKLAFIPAAVGFLIGIGFLLLMDHVVPHLHLGSEHSEGPKCELKKTTMLVLAVTLHNLPEGLSSGAAFAGVMSGNGAITLMGAFALSIGIAIQNFPEGAIISLPLRSEGMSRGKAFLYGSLSGIVEPIGGFLTIWLASYITPFIPYLLAFAAGAMIYVVVEELIPEASEGEHSNIGTIGFAVGFVLMMILDVALG